MRERFMLAAAGVLAALPLSVVAAEAPPAEHFSRRPAIDQVFVSPSGTRMALLVGSKEGRTQLATLTLEPLGEAKIVGAFTDADVHEVRWVNDARLVYSAFEANVAEVRSGRGGTFAVDFDGTNQRQLVAWAYSISQASPAASRILPYGWFVHSTLDDGSDDVLVYRDRRDDVGRIQPARLDTRTGQLRNLAYGMPDGVQWFWADAKEVPRALLTYDKGREQVYWRGSAEEPWGVVAEFDRDAQSSFRPWLVDPEGLIVRARRDEFDALYRFDLATKRLGSDALVAVPGFDLNPAAEVERRSGRLLGIHFRLDLPTSFWFDERMDGVQRGIDKALPGRANRLYCGRCETTRWFVVLSSSDRQSGEYFLFDRESGRLQRIGAARPWLEEATQGRRALHRVKARDGLEIPVYVTHPAGARDDEPLPTVVLVHGGPWLRGTSRSWDAEAQFLASRGYRVLQPEFRGSAGYGWGLFRAGWKAWGGAMQDDLVDAVEWASARKLTDRSRVCIVGGSYGGYAALMAPIVHPQAFRCSVAHAAVTDIGLMYDITWSDMTANAKRYGMPRLIGDPQRDAALLERASPLKRVAELKSSVLLVHGLLDRRVPYEHARKFAAAARNAGVKIEEVNYPTEGHGWFDPANHADYLRRVELFLAQALKPAS